MENKKFVIVADGTCDLSEKFRKEYDIRVIPGHIGLPDGSEISESLRWEHFTRDEFYTNLKKNPTGYTTSPPNEEEFAKLFESCVSEGYDILSISISGGMSGTYRFMVRARDRIMEKYPESRIRCIDSMRFGPGFGLMAIYASMQRSAGKTLDQTADWLEGNKNRFHQAGWLDDLSFVAKKGRITHSTAFFGTLVGVKPIGEFDYNGLTSVIGKVKGTKAAYSLLLSYIEQTAENIGEQTVFIAQTNRYEQAVEYKRLIEEKFHPKAVYINDVFPSCGINIGPGLMAAYYVGKPISSDLSVERGIVDNIIKGEA